MARQSREAALRQAKEAKQKKLLFLLVPVFIGLIAWQGPKTLKAFTGGDAAPPPPAVTTPVPTTPVPTATPPGTTAPAGTPPPTPSGSGLRETDPVLPPLEGQLVAFSEFESKDPFEGLEGTGTSTTTTPSEGTTTTTEGTESETPAAARAVVDVNGSMEDVGISDEFPASDPAFRLVSVSGSKARIGLVSGSFSTGSEAIEINVGQTLILVSDTDGARYVVHLVSVGR